MSLRSNSENQVLVKNITAAVTHRGEAIKETLVSSPDAGAHAMSLLLFDLDQDSADAWEGEMDGAVERVGTSPFFVTHRFTIGPRETEHFRIRGEVTSSFVTWVLNIEFEERGRRRSVVVDNRGQPFRTTHDGWDGFRNRWLCGVGAPHPKRIGPDLHA